ncbi:MAG: ABC transporter substrate-binding protein, partial [Streptosporangiaceae bacterium]
PLPLCLRSFPSPLPPPRTPPPHRPGSSRTAGTGPGRGPASPAARTSAATPVSWADATSAAAGGGLAALVAAAQKEGTLTVIGLPPLWAGYGAIEKAFTRRYGIAIHAVAPGTTSQQQVAAIRRGRGSAGSPDVLDLAAAQALADTSLFAPYKVETWAAIPAAQKAPDGAWADDYGGYMSVGYDAARFGRITSLRQLLGRRFGRAVALDGDPAQAGAALYGVMMAGLALGGGAGDIGSGVAFFRELRSAGNFVPVLVTTPLTIESGSTPVVFNWDFLNTPRIVGQSARRWKVFIPPDGALGKFNAQAISKDAPHPAAARLWEEFLYSQGKAGGQNLWLLGGVRPVEQAAMIANHTIIAASSRTLPPPPAHPVFLTPAQVAGAAGYLHKHWPGG